MYMCQYPDCPRSAETRFRLCKQHLHKMDSIDRSTLLGVALEVARNNADPIAFERALDEYFLFRRLEWEEAEAIRQEGQGTATLNRATDR